MGYQDIVYHHTKGHFYRIIHFGLDEATLEPEVAYRQCDQHGVFQTGQTWHRSCTGFFDGRFAPFDGPYPEPVQDLSFVTVREAAQPLVLKVSNTKYADFLVRDVRTSIERQMANGWPDDGFGDGKL